VFRVLRALAPAALFVLAAGLTACDRGQAPAAGPEAPPPPAHVQQPVKGGTLETYHHDLSQDERRGGHTIDRHVGKSDDELRARLRRERRISTASTYSDLVTAERVVGETLHDGRARIERWTARKGRRPNLALDHDGSPGLVIGRAMRRGARAAAPCERAVVVLKWDDTRGDYYVLTSYPEIHR
jgi:hypothetical protein